MAERKVLQSVLGVLLAGVAFAAPAPGWAQATPMLVEKGRAAAEIVTAGQPARMARLAAGELQAYIEKISGARLPIVQEPSAGATRVYVGVSAHTARLGLEVGGLSDGAFRIASGPGWLALLGPDRDFEPVEPWGRRRQDSEQVDREWAGITGEPFRSPFHWLYMHHYPDLDVWEFDDAGTLNAVHEFLRGLGVRWYAPGELGQVLPRRADIPLPADNRVVRPDFAVRNLRYGYAQHGLGEIAAWNLRLGFDPGHRRLGHVQPGHGIKWVTGRPEMREAHPEFYALRDGERAREAPCLSSEGLFEKHVKFVRALLDHYGEPMVNIDMPDGYGGMMCQCERCRGQLTPERGANGAMSDYVWGYLDRVAREIHRSHPDRMVGGLAYSAYQLPPEKIETMTPNLAIIECRWRSHFHDPQTRDRFRAIREAWLAKLPSREWYIWDYYLHGRPGSRGLPVYFPRLAAADLRELKGVSRGDLIETYKHHDQVDYRPTMPEHDYDPLAIDHLNIYVTSRLWWDAGLDLDALLEEYYTLYYGPARAQMKAFIEYSEQHWPGMNRDAEKIGRALALLEAAQAAVEPDTVHGRRVQRVAGYVQPLYALREQLGRKRENVPRARVLPWPALERKKLDGRLDDEQYWPPLRTLPLVGLDKGDPAPRDRGTWVRVFRAGEALYFGIRCVEPDIAGLAAGRGGDIRAGDFIEILLETSTYSYYRITVNSAGALADADRGEDGAGERWQSGAEAAVHVGDGYWSVEVRVPLAGDGARAVDPLLGVNGRMPSETYPWYFNVVRQRVRGDQTERYAYSPTGGGIEVIEKFAEMWSR